MREAQWATMDHSDIRGWARHCIGRYIVARQSIRFRQDSDRGHISGHERRVEGRARRAGQS